MESLSRPPHRRKHSMSTNASSSSFSRKNPYDGVLLARGSKAKFEPRDYAEIFSGSSSIPVLDLSGLNEPVRPGGCRSSQLDYSNIFGGARDDDVAVSYDQLFNGVPEKTKTRISADAESPFQEHGSLNSSGKAKRVNGVSDDGITQQLNMSFNKTNQTSGNESNGKTHIAQLHVVSGFTHFVDGTHQVQKKGGERPVVSMKRDVSRTWSFRSGIGATTVKGGSSPEKSYTPDKSCSVNGINSESHFSKVQPTSDHLSGSNDNKDIRHSSIPCFAHKDASKEAAGEHSPPLSDEELDENSDAAVSIAALKKAIEQAQESIRLARMIMQKKREGVINGSRARKPKGRSKVEDKKEDMIEHASGGLKENNDPTFSMPTGVVEKSAPILNHSGKHVNARRAKVETVRENFQAASDHGSAFIEVDKKFAPSSSQSGSLSTDEKVEVENIRQNVGAFEPRGERINFTASVETVVSESGSNVDCNDNLICSKAKAVPCLEHLETGDETLEQRESVMHQQEVGEDFFGRPENVVNTSRSVQELEQSPNEKAVEQCQVTVSPIKGHADLGEQLERVLGVSGSTQEQEKITHGGRHLRISKENEPPGYTDSIGDKESCEEKFVGHEELYLDQHSTVPRSNLNTLQDESPRLAEENMVDLADIDKQIENVSEWKEDGQDRKCSDAKENGKAAREEILWFESELQLEDSVEEEISEREPETVPEIGEAAINVNMVLEPKNDDEKLNFELENNSQTVAGEHEENEIALKNDSQTAAETIQIVENNDSDVQNGEISLDVEELNDTDEAAGRRRKLQDNFEESNDSASEKGSSESFALHSDDPGTILRDNQCINTRTIFNETLEPCNDDLANKGEKYRAVRRGCEENNNLPRETEILSAVEDNETGKEFDVELNNVPESDAEKFTESQLNNTFEGFRDSKFTSIALTNAGDEKILPDDEDKEDKFKTTNEFHNAADKDAANTSMQNFAELHVSTDDQVKQCDSTNVMQGLLQTSENSEESQSSSTLESIYEVSSAHESPACRDGSSDKEEVKGQQSDRLNTEDQSHLSQTNCKPKEMYKSVEAERDIKTGQNTENNMQNLSSPSTSEQQEVQGNEQKCEIDDHLQRIEAIKKGREREKDRIAVERVIREARERAFADARERAERASVERAAAEARQRVVGEKTLKKAPVEIKPSAADKASIEAKLRAERAAVERATTEARERALEKAMSQKNSMGPRASTSSRNVELKHSLSPSDSEKFDANRESAQRRKARLERHQRIMERAAKALAEKSMRDLLAQKEQAERSRLAESLDADIKRWSTGKEGNLRALLSTLQYILGPESGWQPIPLTEIVTSAAVKKSYRKATLCVHPDKLQQRGASIQQKYICEKIFDLLKAAWNRFNSEEN